MNITKTLVSRDYLIQDNNLIGLKGKKDYNLIGFLVNALSSFRKKKKNPLNIYGLGTWCKIL